MENLSDLFEFFFFDRFQNGTNKWDKIDEQRFPNESRNTSHHFCFCFAFLLLQYNYYYIFDFLGRRSRTERKLIKCQKLMLKALISKFSSFHYFKFFLFLQFSILFSFFFSLSALQKLIMTFIVVIP